MSDEADDLAGALHRHADDHLDQWDAFTFSSSSGPVWVLISRQEIEGVSHWTPLPEPDALDRLRARVDADAVGREHVERLKQEARGQMSGELTDGQLAELRRLVGQLRHHTPWAASVEWWSDRPLPAEVATDLVQVRTHQAGNNMVADWNDTPVADVQGRDEAVAIAAAVTWIPTLLDEVARLRSREQQAGDMIARGDKEALWAYLVAAAKAHDGQQEGGDA